MANITVIDRSVVRKELALFLSTHMSTPKAIFPYLPASFKGQSPLVAVTSAPSIRTRETPQTYENKFGLTIRNVVIYTLESEPEWTTAMAEDQIDKLEWETSVALLLADQQASSHTWRSIGRQGSSSFEFPKIDGIRYIIEIIPVIVEVDDEPQEQ